MSGSPRQTGSSRRDAKRDRETTEKLRDMPETEEALRKGEISPAQAEEIANTEAAAPGSEEDMLGAAKRKSLGELRDRGRDKRQRSADPEELAARQRKAREIRGWVNDLGMVSLRGDLLPEIGMPFLNRLEAETKRLAKRKPRRRIRQPNASRGSASPTMPSPRSSTVRARARPRRPTSPSSSTSTPTAAARPKATRCATSSAAW